MKFKANACPKPSGGFGFKGVVDQVVPDQSMSLEYILQRFTRGEPLSVGHEVSYGTELPSYLDVDLEKLSSADLVDKAEYLETLQKVKAAYQKQEKLKAEKDKADSEAKARLAEEKKIRIAARKLSKENSKKSA